MRDTATHWRLTVSVTITRGINSVTFRHHSSGVPGTKRQAVAHFKKVCLSLWPSAKMKLVSSKPDRQAEARAAREVAHAS